MTSFGANIIRDLALNLWIWSSRLHVDLGYDSPVKRAGPASFLIKCENIHLLMAVGTAETRNCWPITLAPCVRIRQVYLENYISRYPYSLELNCDIQSDELHAGDGQAKRVTKIFKSLGQNLWRQITVIWFLALAATTFEKFRGISASAKM